MKNLILFLVVVCFSSFCFSQYENEIFQTETNPAQFDSNSTWQGEMIKIPSKFSSNELFDINEIEKLKGHKVTSIVLSYSDYAQVNSFDQNGLNAQRVSALSKHMQENGISTETNWAHIGLPCNSRADAQTKYHGFYIYYEEVEKDLSIDGLFPKEYSEKYSAYWKALGLKKEVQSINVNSGGTLIFSNGHEIKLPPNCLVDKNGNAVTGIAYISFFAAEGRGSLASLGLSTTSGNQLLVTDGSYYIGASQNNEELAIKEGSSITASFNENTVDTGMLLFAGEFSEGKIDWVKPEKMSFGEVAIEKDNAVDTLRYSVSYIKAAFADSLGNRKFLTTAQEHTILNELLNNTPESEFVKAAEKLLFVEKILAFSTPDTAIVFETLEMYNRKLQAKADSTWAAEQNKRLNESMDKVTNQRNEMTNQEKKVELNRYVAGVSQLGWLNCDRFLRNRNASPMTVGAIIANANEYDFVNLSMIFKERNMMVNGFNVNDSENEIFITKNKSSYTNLPKGDKVLLLATAVKDGELYYFTKHFIIKGDEMHSMKLKPIAKGELKKILSNYNQEV